MTKIIYIYIYIKPKYEIMNCYLWGLGDINFFTFSS